MADYWKKYHDKIYKLDEKPLYDNSTANRSYLSVGVDANTTLGYNSIIKFTVWPSDVCIMPSDSYLLIEGRVTKQGGSAYPRPGVGLLTSVPQIAFANNGPLFMFETRGFECPRQS